MNTMNTMNKNTNKIRLFIKFCILMMIALFCKGVAEANYPKQEIRPATGVPAETVQERPDTYPAVIGLVKAQNTDLYDKYFKELAPEARKISYCESGNNPRAISKTGDYGLMQVNYGVWGKEFSISKESLLDPDTNLRIAKQIYDRSGSFRAWYMSFKCHIIN